MWSDRLDDCRLEVEHRNPSVGGGPTLRVRAEPGGREWLRFDCFDEQPHSHLDPEGKDLVRPIDAGSDAIGAALDSLRSGFAALLAEAGAGTVKVPEPGRLSALLRGAEAAMRNPPARLDDLDLATLRSRKSEKWESYPEDILPAWVAEMDFPVADPIRRVLQRAVTLSDIGYPIDSKDTGLPEAFAERMAERFDWRPDPAHVEILSDVVQGMHIALYAFSEPGDGAIVLTPIYPPFLNSLKQSRRTLVEERLDLGPERFEFDPARLAASCDERTRVLLLCNPHNPTGRVFDRDELEALAEIVLERDLVVVSDEIHADLLFGGRSHIPFASLGEEIAERTLTLTSATKAFNIPGLRCAIAHFGSAQLQARFNRAMPRRVRGGMGILGLYATIAAWRHSQPWLDEVRAYLEDNRDFLSSFVAERLPGVEMRAPESTYLAWLDFRALELPTTPGRFLMEHGRVALSDGFHFGSDLTRFARLNFATSRGILEQVLERVAKGLEAAPPRA